MIENCKLYTHSSYNDFQAELDARKIVPFEVAVERVKNLACKYPYDQNTVFHLIEERNKTQKLLSLEEAINNIDSLIDRIHKNLLDFSRFS